MPMNPTVKRIIVRGLILGAVGLALWIAGVLMGVTP